MDDVLLTKLTAEDIELVRKWRNSKDVASYMYNEDYITKENQINWLIISIGINHFIG
jgi:hypothetical protein